MSYTEYTEKRITAIQITPSTRTIYSQLSTVLVDGTSTVCRDFFSYRCCKELIVQSSFQSFLRRTLALEQLISLKGKLITYGYLLACFLHSGETPDYGMNFMKRREWSV